jgi:hypothetical protein
VKVIQLSNSGEESKPFIFLTFKLVDFVLKLISYQSKCKTNSFKNLGNGRALAGGSCL